MKTPAWRTVLGSNLLLASFLAMGLLDSAAHAQSKSNGVGSDPTFTGDATADQFVSTHSTIGEAGLTFINRVRINWSATGALPGTGGAYITADSISDGVTIGGSSTEFLGGTGLVLTGGGLQAYAASYDVGLINTINGRTVKLRATTGSTGTALIAGTMTADGTAGVAGVTLFDFQTGITGTPVSKFALTGDGHVTTTYTDASGAPGNATINKMAGKVAVLNGAAAVTVTNALVTANSNVLVTLQESDVTCTQLLRAVPVGGSFTVTLNAVCTADTNVGFVVLN